MVFRDAAHRGPGVALPRYQSAAANLPEKQANAERLLRNQEDIGNAIKPYYGDAAGTPLTGLLKSHITIATEVIDAAIKGDNAGKEDAARRWGANADDVAGLLSGANPANWPLPEMKRMLHDHLDLTTQEVVAHLGKDWAGSVAAYDRIHVQVLAMADALSAGIAKQFPDKVMGGLPAAVGAPVFRAPPRRWYSVTSGRP